MILFDFGGTLDADGSRWSIRFHDAYRQAGGRLSFDRFEPLFRESDRRLAQTPGIRTMGFRATLDEQGVLLSTLMAGVGETVEPAALAGPVHAAVLPIAARNRKLLSRLAPEHRLGVVSNFCGNLDVCLADLGFLALFDTVIDSAVVGISKPDPRIFQLALAHLSADPTVTWMVGDNPAADLLPAAALGLKTCWLAPPGERHPFPPSVPSARIAALTDLPGIVAVPCTV